MATCISCEVAPAVVHLVEGESPYDELYRGVSYCFACLPPKIRADLLSAGFTHDETPRRA